MPKLSMFRSTVRYLWTGTQPVGDITDADGSTDAAGTPPGPIPTMLPSAESQIYTEGLEDPDAATGLFSTNDPALERPDVGASPVVGAYEGAVRTEGPASVGLGYEVSGGPYGDQALGRRMMFKLPIVMSESSNPYEGRVSDSHWQDELAAALVDNGQGNVSNSDIAQSLLLWTGEN